MEEDQPLEPSLVVSQYEAHLHGSTSNSKHGPSNQSPPVHTSPTRSSPVQKSPVHNSPVHKSPIHSSPVPESPIHKSPVHKSPIHQTPVHTSPVNNSPFIKNPFAQTIATPPSLRLPSVIYDASAHPNSPELHHILFDGKKIFEPISPDPPALSQPKYDSSAGQASQRRVLALSPLRFTPDTSPNKSGDSLPGFIAHSSAMNAFSATATSNPIHVANTISSNIQVTQPIRHCSSFLVCFVNAVYLLHVFFFTDTTNGSQ